MTGRPAAWRTALVTGATAGIGLACAELLAGAGCDVVLVARDAARLAATAQTLKERTGAGVEVLAADLLDEDGLDAVEQRLADPVRPVDLLVNNAGTGTRGRFDALPLGPELAVLGLSATAVLRLSRAVLPGMVQRRKGFLLNVASLAAFQPDPYTATYGAAKAFCLSLSEALHDELRGTGVHVTALCPSFTATEFHERAGIDVSRVPRAAWMTPQRVAAAGLRAVSRNQPVCVPGPVYRAMAAFSTVAPRPLARFGSRLFAHAR